MEDFIRLISTYGYKVKGLNKLKAKGIPLFYHYQIDGYPVEIYINGEFLGLYTWNIPKDKWTFNMTGDENTREALLMADLPLEDPAEFGKLVCKLMK